MAQILHWKGFGDSGEWLNEIAQKAPQLKNFLDLPIRYHSSAQRDQFGGKKILESMFAGLMQKMFSKETKVLTSMVNKVIQDAQPDQICILDCGSGPVGKALSCLEFSKANFNITMTDCWGGALSRILDDDFLKDPLTGKPPVLAKKTAMYQDLNLMGEYKERLENHRHKYHVITTRLALHQCIDLQQGRDVISHFFHFVARALKENGFWLWVDTGGVAYLQGLIIPGNLIDREGYVPSNAYRYVSDLKDIALKIGSADAGTRYRLPLYIPDQRFSQPDSLSQFGGVYSANCLVNATIEGEEFNELQRLKANNSWGLFEEKMAEIIEKQKLAF